MIEHELILLGLLKESPRHGYEIKKEIKEILSLFAGVNLKSIYYPLRVLEKKGLVVKRINKLGRRPERMVYTLTPKGETRFADLLAKSFLNFKRPEFSLDLSLYFLHNLNPRIARRRLRARLVVLKKISKGLTQLIATFKNKKSSSIRHILEHNLNMLDSESQFLGNLITSLGRKE
jgi:DNA-binding PadR family transcriptional regulator